MQHCRFNFPQEPNTKKTIVNILADNGKASNIEVIHNRHLGSEYNNGKYFIC